MLRPAGEVADREEPGEDNNSSVNLFPRFPIISHQGVPKVRIETQKEILKRSCYLEIKLPCPTDTFLYANFKDNFFSQMMRGSSKNTQNTRNEQFKCK